MIPRRRAFRWCKKKLVPLWKIWKKWEFYVSWTQKIDFLKTPPGDQLYKTKIVGHEWERGFSEKSSQKSQPDQIWGWLNRVGFWHTGKSASQNPASNLIRLRFLASFFAKTSFPLMPNNFCLIKLVARGRFKKVNFLGPWHVKLQFFSKFSTTGPTFYYTIWKPFAWGSFWGVKLLCSLWRFWVIAKIVFFGFWGLTFSVVELFWIFQCGWVPLLLGYLL